MDYELLERFKRRFSGLDRAHGQYRVTETEASGKKTGPRKTVRKPAAPKQWMDHLEGKVGLGVVPIRSNGSCVFGAVDVDDYEINVEKLALEVEQRGLPLIPCRTKSGGVHLYLFTSEPVPAKLIRAKLKSWATALGQGKPEIFPKQDSLSGEDDVGSWINLPYFSGDRTTRYAVVGGRSLTLKEFLDHADSIAVNLQKLKETKATPSDDLMADGPPCLQALAMAGIGEGERNETLFALGVFAKNKYPDSWEDRLAEMNQKYFNPSLDVSEVEIVVKSLRRKDYVYPCKRPAMASLCDKTACRKRKFGVTGDSADPGVHLANLQKIMTDPPAWILTVNDQRMQLESTEDLLNQKRFNVLAVERLNILPRMIKSPDWEELIQGLLSEVVELDAPSDAGRSGQFSYLVDYFLTERPKARSKEEMLLGKCWIEDDRAHFRSSDLLKFLDANKFKSTPKEAWTMLRSMKASASRFKVKGKVIRCWAMDHRSMEIEVDPEIPEEPEF